MMKQREYNTKDFSGYVVTGYKYNSKKRFPSMSFGAGTQGWLHANAINLWRGRVYGVLKDSGKRVLLKSVNC